MKNPLHYQATEYDCGPTTLLNGMMYLFDREQLKPEIVRNIILYCLDCFGSDGTSGTRGTSCTAMMFLSNWLNGYGQAGHLPVSSAHLTGEAVHFGSESLVRDCLRRGGCAVLLLDLEGWHYLLLTGIEEDQVRIFDCYFDNNPGGDDKEGITVVTDHPYAYNRIVSVSRLEDETIRPYSMGPKEGRECVLLYNDRTKLTAESTVEYFI